MDLSRRANFLLPMLRLGHTLEAKRTSPIVPAHVIARRSILHQKLQSVRSNFDGQVRQRAETRELGPIVVRIAGLLCGDTNNCAKVTGP